MPRALLESIIEPSKVVAETYRNVAITTKAGIEFTRVASSAKTTRSSSSPHPVDSRGATSCAKAQIDSPRFGDFPNAEGLLTRWNATKFGLLAWLLSGRVAGSKISAPGPAGPGQFPLWDHPGFFERIVPSNWAINDPRFACLRHSLLIDACFRVEDSLLEHNQMKPSPSSARRQDGLPG